MNTLGCGFWGVDNGSSVTSDLLAEHVRQMCSCGERLSGSQAEKANCDYIIQQLKEAGLSPTTYEFKGFASLPLDASLHVIAPQKMTIEALSVSFSASTKEQGLDAELVDVGRGTPEEWMAKDVCGKIALVNQLPRGALAQEALRRGCAGLICCSQSRRQHRLTLSPVWGNPTVDTYGQMPRLPVVSVNAEDGARLAKLCQEGDARVCMHTALDEGWKTMPLPCVEIPGKRPEFLLVGAHYCTWFDGATDNATGSSLLIELAKLFHRHKETLHFGVRICWWPGHSQARYAGSAWYADAFYQDILDNCIAYYNVDSPGVLGATVYAPQDQTAEVSAFNEDCIKEWATYSSLTTHQGAFTKARHPGKYTDRLRPNRASDQAFVGIGVTALSAYSMLEPSDPNFCTYASGCAGAWWWHTIEDTLDKMDPAVLLEDTRIYWNIMHRLTTCTVLPYDFSCIADDYLLELREYAEAAQDRFDFTPLKNKIAELQDAAKNFSKKCAQPLQEDEANKLLRTQLTLCRLLTPSLYSSVDQSEQERAVPTRLLPLLQDALLLADCEKGSCQDHLLTTKLTKRCNKITQNIVEALRLLQNNM